MLQRRAATSSRVLALVIVACYSFASICSQVAVGVPRDTQRQVDASQSLYLPLVSQSFVAAPSDGRASWGAPIATSTTDGSVWVVNPDAGSVTHLDPVERTLIAEIKVGREPWSLAIAPDGNLVYVVDRAAGTLVVVHAPKHRVLTTIAVGAEPGAVALSPSGATAYVTLSSAQTLAVVDTRQFQVRAQVAVDRMPYAIAVTDDGDANDDDESIYLTHFQALAIPGGSEATDTGRQGQVSVVRAGALVVQTQIPLAADVHGFPNLLAGIALSGNRAWVPHLRAAPDLPNSLTTTVFAAVATLDLSRNQEQVAARLPLNDEDVFGSPVNNPVASVPSLDGKTLYVVLAGSNLVEIADVSNPDQPRLVKFLATGTNPRGIALSPDERWGYVMNYLGRSVSVLDLERQTLVETIPVTTETLEPDVLLGKILFNNASDPRMGKVSWMSCASCHADGGTDGVTWMFPDGPRQTPPLWNATRTLPWHWSAALDEPQDVEDTIHTIQFGLGLAPGEDPPILGTPIAGRSKDLDALAAFMEHDIRIPAVTPSLASVAEGRRLFTVKGCNGCHGGPTWTSSTMAGPAGTLDPDGNGMVDAILQNVGTLNPRDVRGASGFDVPSLLNVGLTAPYLHDGSATSLATLLQRGHPVNAGNSLSVADIEQLVTFLRSIDPATPPVEMR